MNTYEIDGVFIIDGPGQWAGALPVRFAGLDSEALDIIMTRANEISVLTLRADGFKRVIPDEVSPATERWADLVESRTGSRPSDHEAKKQIDRLANFFLALQEADLENRKEV